MKFDMVSATINTPNFNSGFNCINQAGVYSQTLCLKPSTTNLFQ